MDYLVNSIHEAVHRCAGSKKDTPNRLGIGDFQKATVIAFQEIAQISWDCGARRGSQLDLICTGSRLLCLGRRLWPPDL